MRSYKRVVFKEAIVTPAHRTSYLETVESSPELNAEDKKKHRCLAIYVDDNIVDVIFLDGFRRHYPLVNVEYLDPVD